MKQCVSCGQFVPETSEVCSSCSSSVRLVSTISSANRIRSLLATSPGRLLTSTPPPSSSARRTSATASAERRESTNRTLRRVGSPTAQRSVHFDALAGATGSPAATAAASSSQHSSFFPPPSSPAHFTRRTSPRRDAPSSSSSFSKHDTPTPIRSRAIITSKRSETPSSQPSWTYPPDSYYYDSTNQNTYPNPTYVRHDDVLSSRFLPSATAAYARNESVNSVPLAHQLQQQQQQPHSSFDVTPVSSRQWQRLWQTAIQSLRRGALQTLGWRYFHRWAVWTGRRQGVGSEARRQLASRLQSTRGDAAGGALSEGTAQPLRDAEERSRRLLVSSELQARGALELAAAFEFHGRRTAALQRQEGGGPRSPSPFSGSLSNVPGDSPTQRTRRVNEIRRLYEENSFAAASARDRTYSSSSAAAFTTTYDVTPVRNQARWAADEHFVFLEKRELLAREEVSRRLLVSSESNTRLGIAAESARQAELTLAAEAKMLEASRLPPPPPSATPAHMMISTPQVVGTKAVSAPAPEPVVTVPANVRVMSEAMQRIQQRRQQQQAQVEQPHRHEVDAAPSATVSVSQPSDEEKSNAAASPPHVVVEQAPKQLLRQRATTLTRAAGAVQSMRRSTREHFTSSLSNPGANRLPPEEDGEEGGGATLRRASPQQPSPAQNVDDSQSPSRRRSSTLVEQPLSGGGSKLNETAQDHYRAQVVQILSDELKHRKAVVMQFRRGMETIVAKAVEAAAQVVVD